MFNSKSMIKQITMDFSKPKVTTRTHPTPSQKKLISLFQPPEHLQLSKMIDTKPEC